jgi:uncharacterized membrane-anchored protein
MREKTNSSVFYAVILAVFTSTTVFAQESQGGNEVLRLPWKSFPASGQLGSVAHINLNNTIRFLDAPSTRRFLELTGNPPYDNEYTVASKTLDWFAIFDFNPIGYVKDNEQLDSNAILRILQEGNREGIAERRRLHLPILTLVGWAVVPHYDIETRRLEWGTRLIDEENKPVVNYTIRLLGRSGVMNAILVSDPGTLRTDVYEFKAALREFDFESGQRYAEFRQGDRVSEYGLAALIVGGAAAAAAKSGALKGLGKLFGVALFGGIAVVGAFFKRVFGKVRTRSA